MGQAFEAVTQADIAIVLILCEWRDEFIRRLAENPTSEPLDLNVRLINSIIRTAYLESEQFRGVFKRGRLQAAGTVTSYGSFIRLSTVISSPHNQFGPPEQKVGRAGTAVVVLAAMQAEKDDKLVAVRAAPAAWGFYENLGFVGPYGQLDPDACRKLISSWNAGH